MRVFVTANAAMARRYLINVLRIILNVLIMVMNKRKIKVFDKDELRRRVSEVLYYVWDLIGISHEPCARGNMKAMFP
jgi:hypothetical protein